MKASVCIEMIYTEYPFLDRIRLAAEQGYDAVEFWNWNNKDLSAIKETARRAGIKIATFQSNLGGTLIYPGHRANFIKSIQHSLEKACEMEAEALFLLTDELGDDRSVRFQFPELSIEEKHQSVLDGLKELSPMAEAAGVTLMLEPLNIFVVTATSNGTYRIYAHDNPGSPGVRGLKIVKNSNTNYWVEFRQKFTSNKWMMSGGGLRWAQSGNQKSQLLDATPGTADGKTDSPLVIGRTFSDRVSNIHLTPIGKGGTSPESLDVVVRLGAFSGNQVPTVSLVASATNAGTGVTLIFNSLATDGDGDPLAYYWSFGDGNFGTNGPVAAKSWAAAGEYVVRCEASDMKGGVGSQSVIVRIGTPTTYRIAGQVKSGGGPVPGARVSVSSTRMAWTDSDGSYTITGLPAGSYAVSASLENYSFSASGFTNSVSVGPNAAGINFHVLAVNSPPLITTQPQNQSVIGGNAASFSVGASGSAPLTYQWQLRGTNLPGANNSTHTIANTQSGHAGDYRVVVTNSLGAVTSAPANLLIRLRPLLSLNFATSNRQPQITLTGTPGDRYVIEASTNLLDWNSMLTVTNVSGSALYNDVVPSWELRKFYRAWLVP